MSNKIRGLVKERELKNKLIAEGMQVTRARGSFGLFDIIALDNKYIYLIQVKRVKGKYYSFKKELAGINSFKNHPVNTKKQLWIWLDRLPGREAGWSVIHID